MFAFKLVLTALFFVSVCIVGTLPVSLVFYKAKLPTWIPFVWGAIWGWFFVGKIVNWFWSSL